MKGTRLWQEAGSPLISGRSRREQPAFTEWAWGAFIGWVVTCVWLTLDAEMSFLSAIIGQLPAYLIALAGSALGALIGVGIARGMGWRRSWMAAAVTASGVALSLAMVASPPLLSLWITAIGG